MPYDKKTKKYMREGNFVAAAMHRRKKGTLRSGSHTGPKVKSRAQAIAIGLSEQRAHDSGQDDSILGGPHKGGHAGLGK